MKIADYQVLFLIVVAILALLVASPALSRLLVYPRTEFFSEFWLLGPGHMAEDYPFNISRGQSYSVYLGLGNQLGYCGYYLIEVKFRNESQAGPTSFGPIESRSPSSVPCLFNITAFVPDRGGWEASISFSLDYVRPVVGVVEFMSLRLNGNVMGLNGLSSVWNETTNRFYGDLMFELWLYDHALGNFGYHGRFVDLKLNMTKT